MTGCERRLFQEIQPAQLLSLISIIPCVSVFRAIGESPSSKISFAWAITFYIYS